MNRSAKFCPAVLLTHSSSSYSIFARFLTTVFLLVVFLQFRSGKTLNFQGLRFSSSSRRRCSDSFCHSGPPLCLALRFFFATKPRFRNSSLYLFKLVSEDNWERLGRFNIRDIIMTSRCMCFVCVVCVLSLNVRSSMCICTRSFTRNVEDDKLGDKKRRPREAV